MLLSVVERVQRVFEPATQGGCIHTREGEDMGIVWTVLAIIGLIVVLQMIF